MSRLFSGTPFDRPSSCPTCGQPPVHCRCLTLPDKKKKAAPSAKNQLDSGLVLTPQNSKAPPDQIAKIHTEKRKANRFVTLISGLDHPANDLPALCTFLKQSLGTGGSVQIIQGARTIELQGEHGDKAATLLQQKKLRTRIL